MRSIGTLPTESAATPFTDYLYLKGIETQVEHEEDGTVSIWVVDDDQVKPASALLAQYRAAPGDPEFQKVSAEAERIRAAEAREQKKKRSTVTDEARLRFEKGNTGGSSWLVSIIIVVCVLVAARADTLLNNHPKSFEFLSKLFITSVNEDFDGVWAAQGLPEIMHGQVWRLITPIFIHFGPIHLFFDMFMLYSLGNFIHHRFGSFYLALLIVATGALSNLAQFYWNGPLFGGMSGVAYGLFGFLWMKGKFDRYTTWRLNPSMIQQLMLWFFLCLFHVIPNVANAAHAVGLVVGLAWGFISAKVSSGPLRR